MACDIRPHRLATLAATCKRLGIETVAPIALDATYQLPLLESAPPFDRVLIDAPCSGTGTLRRNPEIKWRLAATDIARLADVQLSLLRRATETLKRNGRQSASRQLRAARRSNARAGFQANCTAMCC